MLVCGQCVLDRVHEPGEPPVERLGGAPWFAAAALRHAGRTAAIATRGGDGGAPRAAARLRPAGHGRPGDAHVRLGARDLRRRRATPPARAASATRSRRRTPRRGWRTSLADARTVVVGAQWRDDFPGETLAAYAAGGRTVLLDGQGPARVPGSARCGSAARSTPPG